MIITVMIIVITLVVAVIFVDSIIIIYYHHPDSFLPNDPALERPNRSTIRPDPKNDATSAKMSLHHTTQHNQCCADHITSHYTDRAQHAEYTASRNTTPTTYCYITLTTSYDITSHRMHETDQNQSPNASRHPSNIAHTSHRHKRPRNAHIEHTTHIASHDTSHHSTHQHPINKADFIGQKQASYQ